MLAFLLFIVAYGTWKSQKQAKDVKGFLLANKSAAWFTVALSIAATQASAITFISTPGQAYADGMRFVQFYLGMPIAMIILSITFVPIYHKLNVYTAYEYLEKRFDTKNRIMAGLLFLISRGIAAGLTLFAPALFISVVLGWNLQVTVIVIGVLVIVYTASGGTDAVNKTHFLQMIVIMFGMVAALFMIFKLLPVDVSVMDATRIAGKIGKLNAIDFNFDLNNRYTFWSGIFGGVFLFLSYFGTDQSQVQRYLSGSSVTQSRMGLLVNGVVKVPMQFFILFIGAMTFVFFQFEKPPIFFNPVESKNVNQSIYAKNYRELENKHEQVFSEKKETIQQLLTAMDSENQNRVDQLSEQLRQQQQELSNVRTDAVKLIQQANPLASDNDTNYIFLSFIISYFPIGLIGLVLAAIVSASMSSTAAELNSLASTSLIDIYKRLINPNATEQLYVKKSKQLTIAWGVLAISIALFANHVGTLIEAVNILGSLFYGPILGIFLVAFYLKKIGGTATFAGTIVAQIVVFICYSFDLLPYLWFNLVGPLVLVIVALITNPFLQKRDLKTSQN
ncbi:MAG: sodium:solute symporter [Calditrichaeota bacterium]|nr:sodium:solute symporter [Calditrichota bacterium]